jgi:hypothetical protein
MATIITDPTNLVSGGDGGTDFISGVTFDVATKVITLVPTTFGSVAADGISGQALYSAAKIVWKNSSTYIKYPFPMEAITPEQFDFKNGWTLDTTDSNVTRKSLRTCGWTEFNSAGTAVIQRWMGVISLGSLGASDTSYFQWDTDAKIDFTFPDALNEGIQIFGDVSNGNFNYYLGSNTLTLFNRIQSKLFSSATNISIGAPSLSYIVYRFPLSNATDLNITATDAHIEYSDSVSATAWSAGVATFTVADSSDLFIGSRVYLTSSSVAGWDGVYTVKAKPLGTTFTADVEVNPGSTSTATVTAIHGQITTDLTGTTAVDVDGDAANENYSKVATDASGVATTAEIYEKLQYLLRQSTDIDSGAGTQVGNVYPSLASFVGDLLQGVLGFFISGLNDNFLNNVSFIDDLGVARNYPFISSGTISFGPNAGSGDFEYFMFYTSLPSGTNTDYGEANATIVDDKDGNPITGTYSGSSVTFSFKYESETAGGNRTAGVDAPITIVGLGLAGGQFLSVTSTITRSQGISILLAPAQERNYDNP